MGGRILPLLCLDQSCAGRVGDQVLLGVFKRPLQFSVWHDNGSGNRRVAVCIVFDSVSGDYLFIAHCRRDDVPVRDVMVLRGFSVSDIGQPVCRLHVPVLVIVFGQPHRQFAFLSISLCIGRWHGDPRRQFRAFRERRDIC